VWRLVSDTKGTETQKFWESLAWRSGTDSRDLNIDAVCCDDDSDEASA
jgi:hypothetical protein